MGADSFVYPECEPFVRGELAPDGIHTLSYEECGRPDGEPILFIHGGPGAGCWPFDRRFFDPHRFHVVLLDQRGCGRSRPLGELRENDPERLIEDFERLRDHLGIESWHVFGGSWGSTLGLAYAQAHPERCRSLVLRGIWLFRQQDLDWWFYGMRRIQPESWRRFADHVPPERRDDLLEAYWELLTGADRERALAAAREWSVYEGSACTLLPNPDYLSEFQKDDTAWSLARLEAHFFRNGRFTPDDRLLGGIDRIRHLPAFLVHGRYDAVCPVEGADALHRAWPESELVIVPDAGHSSHEPGIAKELVAACDRIAASGDPRRHPVTLAAP